MTTLPPDPFPPDPVVPDPALEPFAEELVYGHLRKK